MPSALPLLVGRACTYDISCNGKCLDGLPESLLGGCPLAVQHAEPTEVWHAEGICTHRLTCAAYGCCPISRRIVPDRRGAECSTRAACRLTAFMKDGRREVGRELFRDSRGACEASKSALEAGFSWIIDRTELRCEVRGDLDHASPGRAYVTSCLTLREYKCRWVLRERPSAVHDGGEVADGEG